jgi:hypothetical protein
MENLGKIGIADIPQLSNADKVKVNLPLMEDLCASVKSTDYANPSNKATALVIKLSTDGGDVYFSQDAISKYGEGQVRIAMAYFKEFMKSSTPSQEDRVAVCGWIASNIFDIEKMSANNE